MQSIWSYPQVILNFCFLQSAQVSRNRVFARILPTARRNSKKPGFSRSPSTSNDTITLKNRVLAARTTNLLPHHNRANHSIRLILVSLIKSPLTGPVNPRKLLPLSLGNKHNVSSGLLGKYNPFSHFIIHVIR